MLLDMLLLASENGRWDGPWWGGFIVFLLVALLFFFVISRFFWFRPWRRWQGHDSSPEGILRRRLARGEIDADEYRRLRDVLS